MASANDIIETPARIEPARLEETPEAIADAIVALSSASAALGARLHPATAASLSDLVRLMNCYYSNLIEGHDTRPRDIARALVGDLDEDEGRRDLQIEAAAHVCVQEKIDRLAAEDRLPEPASRDFIRWLHAELYRDAPEAMLSIESDHAEFRMAPGEWRSAPEHDVAVGRPCPAVEPFGGTVHGPFRAALSLRGEGSGGAHPGHGRRASPVELHSPLPGRAMAG